MKRKRIHFHILYVCLVSALCDRAICGGKGAAKSYKHVKHSAFDPASALGGLCLSSHQLLSFLQEQNTKEVILMSDPLAKICVQGVDWKELGGQS